MKNKILFGINSTVLVTAVISLFLPIDCTYIYGINLVLGILSLFFLFVTFFVKREKQFLILFFFNYHLFLFGMYLLHATIVLIE